MIMTRNLVAHSLLLCGLAGWIAAVDATPVRAQETPADAHEIQVLPLKHANALEVLRVIEQLQQGGGVELAGDAKSNALVVKASPQSLDQIKHLVSELDTEQGTTRQVKIFQLQNLVPGPALENMLATVAPEDARFAMDPDRKLVVAIGSEASLRVVEALLNRLDTEGSGAPPVGPPATEMQLRLVWLVGGLADDAAAAPPPDLEGVAQELTKIGVTNLTMAAQMVVNVTEGEKFTTSGSAKVNQPCAVKLSGVLGGRNRNELSLGEQPSLRLEITATSLEDGQPLCQLQTTITTPPGQSVVVGVTPVDSKPAVFVVQVLPRAGRPAQ
jgi:hypothetical protein